MAGPPRLLAKEASSFLRTTDITKGAIDWSAVPYCQEAPPDINKYLVKPNDILISRAGSVGFSTLIASLPSPTVFASYLIRFVPCEHVTPKFVAYFLRSAEYWDQISDAAAGIALANVNAAKLADVEVPLSPLNEQKRIADKLDAVFARVDACRERLDRVPAILKRFRQAVLAAATSGKPTEEWREENARDSKWPRVELGAAARDFSYGSAAKSSKSGSVPVLRMGNIQDGRLDWNDLVYTSVPEEIKKYRLTAGDVLFNRTNSPELGWKNGCVPGRT